MKLNAYILAADPAWIEASVLSYYDVVDRIVVSYDETSISWTGAPIDVEQCLQRLRAIDSAGKFDYRPGHFARQAFFDRPMENDTHQRQVALDQASEGAEWVLQFDTDEVLPNSRRLLSQLEASCLDGPPAIEWPMKVLFRSLGGGRYLQVVGRDGRGHYEYPGPIAVRPGVRLKDARRTDGAFMRLVVVGDDQSLQVRRSPSPLETRSECLSDADAVLHNSWGRSSRSVCTKIRSWGHHNGLRSWWFYYRYWLPSPWIWRAMKDFHPFHRPLWPALEPVQVGDAGVE